MNDRIDGVIVDARVLFVWLDSIKRPHFDLHGSVLSKGEETGKGSIDGLLDDWLAWWIS